MSVSQISGTYDVLNRIIINAEGPVGASDTRIARFDAVADMPASITSEANVTSDIVHLNTFSSTARRIQVLWHSCGLTGPDTQATQAFFGEVALGAFITINAPDESTAISRLLYTDLTGNDTSTSGKANVFMVSRASPRLDVLVDVPITRIDLIGIPNGLSTTHLDVILPCFCEVRVLG